MSNADWNAESSAAGDGSADANGAGLRRLQLFLVMPEAASVAGTGNEDEGGDPAFRP